MPKPEIAGIASFFVVRNVPRALSFYRDRLGFDISYQGPEENDTFFGIVQRGGAMQRSFNRLRIPMTACGDLKSKMPTDIFCFSDVLMTRRKKIGSTPK